MRIARREMVADIAFADRAEQGVGERVEHDVGVAMAGQAAIVRDLDAAQPQFARRRRRRGRRSPGRCGSSGARPAAASARAKSSSIGELVERSDRPRPSRRRRPAARATWASSVAPRRRCQAAMRAPGSRRSGRPAASGRGRRPSRGTGSPSASPPQREACRRPAAPGPRRRCIVERVEQPVDHRGGKEGPGGVVDQDLSAPPSAASASSPLRTDCLARRAAGDRARGGRGRRSPRGRGSSWPAPITTRICVDRGMAKPVERMGEQRRAAEPAILLGKLAARAAAAPRRHHQCHDLSRARPCVGP